MAQTDDDRALVTGLVEWAQTSVRQVAMKAGVSASTINRHFNGTATTVLSRDTIAKLRAAFPDYPAFITRNTNIGSEVAAYGDRPFDEKFGANELPAIPVVGSAIGMASFDPERDIELTELSMAEVSGFVRRPASLAHDNTAYALTVIGDSMAPKYEPGARVIVSPKAPILVNDYVVVQLKSPDPEDQFAERVTTVLIKRLVRRNASHIELRQFNPDETFPVPTERIGAMHKVIGEVY